MSLERHTQSCHARKGTGIGTLHFPVCLASNELKAKMHAGYKALDSSFCWHRGRNDQSETIWTMICMAAPHNLMVLPTEHFKRIRHLQTCMRRLCSGAVWQAAPACFSCRSHPHKPPHTPHCYLLYCSAQHQQLSINCSVGCGAGCQISASCADNQQ